MGLLDKIGFNRLKESLTKTRDSLFTKVTRLVTASGKVDDDFLDQLEEILIGADVGVDTTTEIIRSLKARAKQDRFESSDELMTLLKDEIRKQLGENPERESDPFAMKSSKPYVMVVVGINGAGKTTTVGKLAAVYVRAGKKVVIGAADTFRAAANEQLEIWADRAGAKLIRQQQGSDPAAVAFDAVRSAVAQEADIVLIDTAGRLHTKVNLMEELKKIRRAVEKVLPGAPQEVLLVVDASTGQNGLRQAQEFGSAVGVTGLILTKLDGTAKGGIVLAIAREKRVPVRFIGVGEKLDDLQPFDRAAFTDALFGEDLSAK
jgi:fused signal recognition particle receptor